MFEVAEKEATKALKRALKTTPVAEWVKETVGVGEKQGARLLAVIGHPRWRYESETEEWHPRTIAQLWAYCGYHVVPAGGQRSSGTHRVTAPGVAPSRARGKQGNWNTQARTRAYLIAESCIKQMHSPYRKVYDHGREKYAEAKHESDCKRCGPSGKPALAGSDLSDGHKHARAMRLTAKVMLKDLWIAAGEDQVESEAHKQNVLVAA